MLHAKAEIGHKMIKIFLFHKDGSKRLKSNENNGSKKQNYTKIGSKNINPKIL